MFIKNLLVAGMLVVGVVAGLDQPLNRGNNDQSDCKRMEESDFFNDYSNLRINIGSRIGFQNLKDLDPARFGKLQENMSTIEDLLSDVCVGVVANYSKDKEEELTSLTEKKFRELSGPISDFFEKLGDALKARKDSIGFWEEGGQKRII